ncbi:MAG TPA: efflux transporter outer membrane subunit [Thermomonas sp.]|jgi:NodT family efflux transporter outer membrane factor (OMF) lipoprotein|uniref:efflux transporter outer membrane subunit n=1 Tax=Thermomonas sp. TaxID=1971895 RepID=UPI002D04B737|nr:efflux transporter outer membrane subunit [Thermomonas sp.]
MSRPSLLATALATALLATACASSGDIAPRGAMRDAGSLQSSASLAGTRVSDAAWPSERWWTAFGDPQLDALVDEALANAPSIEAADARTRKAIAQAGLADAARKPTVGAGAQVLGAQLPPALVGDEIGGDFKVVNVLTLSFAWNPDVWGVSRSKWQAAVGSARATEVDAQSARLALAANVARSYVGLARAFDALDAANAEAARADGLISLNQQRIKAGLDNTIALNQNRSAAAAARQQAQAAQHDIDSMRNALAALLGAGPDRGLEIARPMLKTPGIALPSVLPSDLLARRADIVAARWRVEAAQHGIDASKAAFYPSINLSALAGLAAGNLGDLFGSDALLLNGGPALSLPIFEGGRLEQQLRSSDADRDLAVANYNETLVGAIRDVANAVQAARALDAQVASTTVARDAAARAHALVLQRQRAGLATQLDVLAAQAPLLRLDQQLAALVAARRIASIDLDQALGGGIAVDSPNPTASHSN